MFFLLYRQKDIDEMKYKFRREITEIVIDKLTCDINEN